jgi:hypothetical protein
MGEDEYRSLSTQTDESASLLSNELTSNKNKSFHDASVCVKWGKLGCVVGVYRFQQRREHKREGGKSLLLFYLNAREKKVGF